MTIVERGGLFTLSVRQRTFPVRADYRFLSEVRSRTGNREPPVSNTLGVLSPNRSHEGPVRAKDDRGLQTI